MVDLQLTIPKGVYAALKLPEDDVPHILLVELAVSLYQRGILSFGKARELADMNKWEFHELLGQRKVPRHYNWVAFEEDFAYGDAHGDL